MATPETIAEQEALQDIGSDYEERFGFHDPENYLFKAPKGLTRELVEQISKYKNEPDWMLQFRLRALEIFFRKPMPARLPPHVGMGRRSNRWSDFSRTSRIQSGSPFIQDISSTMSSERPFFGLKT